MPERRCEYMASCEKEVGGVMGYITKSQEPPPKISYNFDAEVRNGRVNGGIVEPNIAQIVERAAYYSDLPTTERTVKRFRWDPYGE